MKVCPGNVLDIAGTETLCSWALVTRLRPGSRSAERWAPGGSIPRTQHGLNSHLYQAFAETFGTESLLVSLALGRVKEPPFEVKAVQELKASAIAELHRRGIQLERKTGDREDVPIDYRYLDLLLRAAGDPEYAQGIRLGPGVRMPRLPALYKQKKRWRIPEQADPLVYLECPQAGVTWRRNFSSLDQWKDKALEVLHDQSARGQVLILPEHEARRRYPDLVVASLGAICKDKPNGEVTARVLFDGTHGLWVNRRTRIRDQERSPIASDLKRALHEKATRGERTFALSADVSEAHRQVLVHPQDWHLLGCQVVPGADVFTHTVGTFGVSSASYYWSRVAGSIGRLAQYLVGKLSTSWHMLVADDFMQECGGPRYRMGLIIFFVFWSTCGVPLSWSKTAGGDSLVSVGFEILLRSYSLGLSHWRAEWFVKWTTKVAIARTIHMAAFEEGLGRIMFVVGALEHERPFLGPLYKFMTMHPSNAVRRIPPYVGFILRYLAGQIQLQRHYECGTFYSTDSCAPRVDAQASDVRAGLGGWFPTRGSDGVISVWDSPWFSMEVAQKDFPWVYERGNKPSLVFSTIEALAIVAALKLRYGQEGLAESKKIMVVPSVRDNRGNGAVLKKNNVDEVSVLGSHDGASCVHETAADQDDCRVGAPGV